MLTERPKFCVDWDGVCGAERREDGSIYWPEVGPWLPGAVDGLRFLSMMGLTVICSTRFNVLEYDHKAPRPAKDVNRDILAVRERLDEAGLHAVEIYEPQWGKPPADYYIDDKALHFDGSWNHMLAMVGVREVDKALR